MKKSTILLALIQVLNNLVFSQNQNWENYTCSYKIYDIEAVDNQLWVATIGGVATIEQTTGEVNQYNRSNSAMPDIFTFDLEKAANGDVWMDTYLYGLTSFDGINWSNFTESNSNIPGTNNRNVKENINGDVWMYSIDLSSLVKFDGTNWTSYNSSNSNLPVDIGSNFVFDHIGNLWISTANSGLVKFDGTNNVVIFDTSNSSIPSNQIYDIDFDLSGQVWIATDYGVSKFDGNIWTTFNTSNSLIPSNHVMNIEINNNQMWGIYKNSSSQYEGLFSFDGLNWNDYNPNNSDLPNEDFWQLEVTNNGDKWLLIGSWPELKIIQFNGTQVKYHDVSNSPLKGNEILDIDFDKNGKLWISDFGEIAYQGQIVTYENYNWENYYLPTGVSWLTRQNDSTIWVGQYNRLGKFVYNGTSASLSIYNTLNSNIPTNTILCAAVDTLGNMWFGTSNSIINYNGVNWVVYDTSNSPIPPSWVSDILVDSLNNIWVGTQYSGVMKFDGLNWTVYNTSNSNIASNLVGDMQIDNQGFLWVSLLGHGVSKFDGNNWALYDSSNAIIPYNNPTVIKFDNQNNIWIGSQWGASHFDGTNWVLYTTENSGLPHNDVRDLDFDEYGNVWIATGGGGIGVFNPNGVELSVIEYALNNNKSKQNHLVYPNPFQNIINVKIKPELIGSTFILYNIQGQIKEKHKLNFPINNLSSIYLEQGVYFYQILKNKNCLGSGKLLHN